MLLKWELKPCWFVLAASAVVIIALMGNHIANLQDELDAANMQIEELTIERDTLEAERDTLEAELEKTTELLIAECEYSRTLQNTLRKLQSVVYASPQWFKHIDITIPSLLTEEEIRLMLSGTPLEGLEGVLSELEREHKVNAIVVVAMINHETWYCQSRLAQPPWNNLLGWGAYDSDPYGNAWRFESYEDCLRTVVPLIKQNYVERRGLTTLARAGPTYATDPLWADKVSNHVAYASRGVFERSVL